MLVYQLKHQFCFYHMLDISESLIYVHLKEKFFHLFGILNTKLEDMNRREQVI